MDEFEREFSLDVPEADEDDLTGGDLEEEEEEVSPDIVAPDEEEEAL